MEQELALGCPGSAGWLAVEVGPEMEIDEMGTGWSKGNSFDSVVQGEPRGMARVLHMSSSALCRSRVGPIEDRLAVAVGTQALVASTVVGHGGQSARGCMVCR